jgi:hypothetical protein
MVLKQGCTVGPATSDCVYPALDRLPSLVAVLQAASEKSWELLETFVSFPCIISDHETVLTCSGGVAASEGTWQMKDAG